MRLLIADKLPESLVRRLEALGLEIDVEPGLDAQELAARLLEEISVVIVRSTRIGAEAIRQAPALQLIVRAGAGYNTIDVAEASAQGVFVANCPGKNAVAVAELTIGLLLALDRQIHTANDALKQGKWRKKDLAGFGRGLLGRRLGVLGCGNAGQEVIKRAKAMGIEVHAWSRSLDARKAEALGVQRAESPLALAGEVSMLSVHLARCPETIGFVDAEMLAALPEDAMIVNTSRGGILDEQALLEQLDAGRLRYASDVFTGEPGSSRADFEHPIAQHPRALCTPHIAASTTQAQQAVADEAARVIECFLREGQVPNCVNLAETSHDRWQINLRHRNEVGVLANVLVQIREAGINVEQLQNMIFEGDQAAFARIRLSSEPERALLDDIEALDQVFDAALLGPRVR